MTSPDAHAIDAQRHQDEAEGYLRAQDWKQAAISFQLAAADWERAMVDVPDEDRPSVWTLHVHWLRQTAAAFDRYADQQDSRGASPKPTMPGARA